MGVRLPKLFLQDIFEATCDIEDFVSSIDFEDFTKDKKTYNAVIRSLEIIGEASANVSDEVKEKNNEVNWREMVGMRNIVIHEYFGTDNEIIWQTIKEDIPKLKLQIKNIIDKI